jgi:hypothetical protein
VAFSWRLRLLRSAMLHEQRSLAREFSVALKTASGSVSWITLAGGVDTTRPTRKKVHVRRKAPDEYADYRLVSKVKDKEVAADVEQGDQPPRRPPEALCVDASLLIPRSCHHSLRSPRVCW